MLTVNTAYQAIPQIASLVAAVDYQNDQPGELVVVISEIEGILSRAGVTFDRPDEEGNEPGTARI